MRSTPLESPYESVPVPTYTHRPRSNHHQYFQVRARAEAARMIIAFGGLTHTEEDCSSYFGKTFQECKKEAGLLPFGQLPLLEVDVDGEKTLLAQSGSINRYLAKLANCAPEDPLAAAECDMYHEAALELSPVNPVVNVFRGQMDDLSRAQAAHRQPPSLQAAS